VDRRAVILAAAVAAGCKGASADAPPADKAPAWSPEPRHGIDVPADWKELPEVAATAVTAARNVREDLLVHGHAWGEPSRGCYLAVVELHGKRRDTIPTLKKELEAAVGEGVEITAWTSSPDAEDSSQIEARFTGKGFTGQLRAQLILDRQRIGHALAAACFYNDREPAACENACTPLLAMLAPLEAPPEP
jgi:hypothetical protein